MGSSAPRHVREATLEITVLLSQMPGMLREILADVLSHEPDLRIVGLDDHDSDLMQRIDRHGPDVLLMGEPRDPDHHEWHEVLAAHPRLKVLAVEGSARTASLYELVPRRTRLGEASPGGVIRWVRRSMEPLTIAVVEAAERDRDTFDTPEGRFHWLGGEA